MMTTNARAGRTCGCGDRVMLTAAILLTTGQVTAEGHGDGHHATTTAIGHGPIGVMGEHVHGKGEFMVSYRFMRMDMAGSRIGAGCSPIVAYDRR